jgi:hypothetical protein
MRSECVASIPAGCPALRNVALAGCSDAATALVPALHQLPALTTLVCPAPLPTRTQAGVHRPAASVESGVTLRCARLDSASDPPLRGAVCVAVQDVSHAPLPELRALLTALCSSGAPLTALSLQQCVSLPRVALAPLLQGSTGPCLHPPSTEFRA